LLKKLLEKWQRATKKGGNSQSKLPLSEMYVVSIEPEPSEEQISKIYNAPCGSWKPAFVNDRGGPLAPLINPENRTITLVPFLEFVGEGSIFVLGSDKFTDQQRVYETLASIPGGATFAVGVPWNLVAKETYHHKEPCGDEVEIIGAPEHSDFVNYCELIDCCPEKSLLVFCSDDDHSINHLVEYAVQKEKLLCVIPPSAEWSEYESRKLLLAETRPWMNDDELWRPAPERNEQPNPNE